MASKSNFEGSEMNEARFLASSARLRSPSTDVVDIMDTNRFEQMGRIANVMAISSLIPESLAGFYEGTGNNRVFKPFPIETVKANCFLIVNQSVRWGLDPFAVAQATSIVRGKSFATKASWLLASSPREARHRSRLRLQ